MNVYMNVHHKISDYRRLHILLESGFSSTIFNIIIIPKLNINLQHPPSGSVKNKIYNQVYGQRRFYPTKIQCDKNCDVEMSHGWLHMIIGRDLLMNLGVYLTFSDENI